MKIVKRIVTGLAGTVALTSFILFALDAYSTDQAASHSAVQTNTTIADKSIAGKSIADKSTANKKKLSEETTLHSTSTKEERLSIGASERHMLYQPQDTKPEEHKAQSKKSKKTKDNSFQTVTEDYFSDALFIGDSRTVGMMQSHLLEQATYYAKTGIGIGDILTERIVNEDGWMISVKEALSRHSFGKVYIMIGINDIARGDVDWFTGQYENILTAVRQTQPDAVIYIQGNIPMSYGTQDLNGALNNKNLSLRNEASRALSDAENIFYLDIDKIYMDANGNLKSDYTTDGLHVSSNYYPYWTEYLMHHAVVR